jgi:hypothetical protein
VSSTSTIDTTSNPTFTTENGSKIMTVNSIKYIYIQDMSKNINSKYKFIYDSNTDEIRFVNKENNDTIIDHLKVILYNGDGYIDYNYFQNTLISLLK